MNDFATSQAAKDAIFLDGGRAQRGRRTYRHGHCLRDISERRTAERERDRERTSLRLAQEVAQIVSWEWDVKTGKLVWIGDPTPIFLAKSSPEVSAETQGYLDLADRELRRVSNIASQTLRFHKQTTSPTNCTGESLFRELLSIYQGRLVNSHVQVEERYEPETGVGCFEGEIRQVLSNLVANAIDAMPHGGRLLLRNRKITDPRSGRPGMMLTVADTGTGMSPATRQKIFEAFYTTKGIGGTGLGLWVSKEIIERHKGALYVRSSQVPGHTGTVFSIFLPFEAAVR